MGYKTRGKCSKKTLTRSQRVIPSKVVFSRIRNTGHETRKINPMISYRRSLSTARCRSHADRRQNAAPLRRADLRAARRTGGVARRDGTLHLPLQPPWNFLADSEPRTDRLGRARARAEEAILAAVGEPDARALPCAGRGRDAGDCLRSLPLGRPAAGRDGNPAGAPRIRRRGAAPGPSPIRNSKFETRACAITRLGYNPRTNGACPCRARAAESSISNYKRRIPMLKEFKEFAMRGNVLDMAVGIIIGAAFGKIVASAVDDILMPPIGKLLGHVDFSNLFFNLGEKSYETLAAAKAAGAPTLNYGVFLNTIINFVIVAFAVFLVVRSVNRWTAKPAAATAPTTKDCPQCAMPIPIAAKKCGHCTSAV